MAHTHNDSQGSTLAEKNQKYWNAASKSVFKEKWIQDLQQQIFEYLRSNTDWIGIRKDDTDGGAPPKKMLDYACGNGLPSQALSPYFSTCIGLDVSEGMIEKYNAAARERGLTETHMHARYGDLMAPDVDPSLLTAELSDFDLVTICMALHHLEDPPEAVKRLMSRLKLGGVLLVIDWATSPEKYQQQLRRQDQEASNGSTHGHQHQHDDHDHGPGRYPAAHTVTYDSFAKEQIEGAFKGAGCEAVDFVLHPRPSVVPMATGGQMQLFFARGRKGGG